MQLCALAGELARLGFAAVVDGGSGPGGRPRVAVSGSACRCERVTVCVYALPDDSRHDGGLWEFCLSVPGGAVLEPVGELGEPWETAERLAEELPVCAGPCAGAAADGPGGSRDE
jgi:hypothetical protein